ncbi:hypothetical protein POJ06DRAFT_254950 [Lipomyces tetrasporus]|uniref:Tafazzin n=1 Tax=Lipomyces tetrasporus TaxID=54092 RepID=A0AAD7QS43_9ASCO|nr:uncharacterized protein POJ06DRAFT_254950 [Lipomyces tetrasporus]KAJ8099936.1 hypothetical protein POJ06DRAFT_254950 [Lipomyces tetrasporus]
MPKHHANANTLTKHYAALSSSSSSRQQHQQPKSVNELIQESRARSNAMAAAAAVTAATATTSGTDDRVLGISDAGERTIQTYPLSLSAYLADPVAADSPVPAAPARRTRRTFAGPPPPPTWLAQERSNFAVAPGKRHRQRIDLYAAMTHMRSQPQFQKYREERNILGKNLPPAPISSLSELLPRQGSLMHWCLVRLTRDWEFNVVYLQHYLPMLEPTMKMVLVAYLGRYSQNGIGPQGLRLLFDPKYISCDYEEEDDDDADKYAELEESEDDIELSVDDSNDHITSLDLTFQIDDSNLSLAMLAKFIAPKQSSSPVLSWQHALPTTRAFPFLSALSLSHPSTSSPTKLWSTLLSLLKSNPTLIALSLAQWPIPPDMFYSSPDTQAQIYPARSCISTLRSLSKTSFCLKWIDFSYCSWLDEQVIMSAEWTNGWRNVRTLVLRGLEANLCEKIREEISEVRGESGEAIEVVMD